MKRPPVTVSLLLACATAGFLASFTRAIEGQAGPTEALTGFDNVTNGFITQADFNRFKATFEERDEIADGLGPVFNAQSCVECHQNPVSGGNSQVAELRAGHRDGAGNFVDAPGGSLINDRAINAAIQERVPGGEDVRTLRMSNGVLGAGFVEAINSNTLVAIANGQPAKSGGLIAGQVIQVPVNEQPGARRVGRFGWKNQHASLLSFSGDAYLNEMGITNRLNPTENNSMGRSIAAFRMPSLPAVEDEDNDVDQFAAFMRATKAPPRDTRQANTFDAIQGASLFNRIGCDTCHVPSITTSSVGSVINGGALTVPAALGNKIIHPFGDFLLHDVGTGDGIVQNGGQATANKLRTVPLWGVRTHNRHMHDGRSLTFTDAILRHGGEARGVTQNFRNLSGREQNQIVEFLKSL